MNYILRELRIGDLDLHDAQLLADMWNASESGWPGGWTGGVPETAERILERTQKMNPLGIFVVEVNGEIVGFGDAAPTPGRDDTAYLGLLNVRPDFHGKGLGKALVLKVLERAIESGRSQLLIDTWAGNEKSVPLYKKTGFFWIPETSVDMQNFIPTALKMPIAGDFFNKHYWYACFQRELEIVPDDIEWNGIQVYPYRFEEDGDLFAMWIDRQAEAPTAVETNDLYVACAVGEKEIVCGVEYKAKWEIVNKKGAEKPLQLALIVEGDEGIGLKVVENYEIRDKIVIEKPFTIQPDVKPKERGMPAHQIKSTLLLNGVPVVLGTAVKPVQPVDIQFSVQMVVSGKPDEEVRVKLKSNLDFPVKGELVIDPNPALKFDKLSAPFSLEPKSWTSCVFRLQLDDTGAFTTKMRAVCPPELNPDHISDTPLTTKAKTVTFLTQPLDSVYAWHDKQDKIITIETPTIRARVRLRGGNVSVNDRMSGQTLCSHRAPELGPPFVGWRTIPPTYPYRLEQKDGKVSITLIMPSDNLSGVTIEKTITVGAGSFIRIDHRILNATDAGQKSKLRCETWDALRERNGRITLPLKDGLLHEQCEGWGSFPLREDLSKKPEDYAENWRAIERDGIVAGIVFGECEECEGMTLQFDLPEIPPRSHYGLEPFYLVAGRGNWEVVRQLWRRLQQPSAVREKRKPIAHSMLDASFDPAPLLITRQETNVKLAVHNRRGKILDGRWQIQDCGLQMEPSSGELSDVKQDNPFAQEMSVTATDLTPRVDMGRIAVVEKVTTSEFAAPVVVLGNADEPVVYNSESPDGKPATISVDNGYFSFTVAPTFLGSVTALERNGVNHLKSSYPKAGPYVWMNPWFGGILPSMGWMGNQWFSNERFAGEQVERTGKSGITWRGVKVGSDLQQKDRRWLRIEIEYLTIGGSNVLAIVHRLINRTDAPQGIESNMAAWLAVGGSIANNILHYGQDRPRYGQAASTNDRVRVLRHRRRGDYGFSAPVGRWGAVENPETGDVIALIASHPGSRIEISIEGRDSAAIMTAGGEIGLEPQETKETVLWLVISDSVAEARKYQALGEVYELP